MNKKKAIILFFIYSLIGIFMFFVPIKIGVRKTIPIDHLVKAILKIKYLGSVYGLIIITVGLILPFYSKTWNKSKMNLIMTVFNISGFIFTIMSIFKIGPQLIIQDTMAPYVLEKVVIPVILIVPVGSIFLAFLISYGLMEGIGVLMEPVMKPVFRTPGKSALDAVTSFVGSYSLALLVTNRVYRENKYTAREAAIIATGFSTVSATFMIITVNTLGLMEYWTIYFWVCLVVTFVVTAITARLYPLSRMPNTYFDSNHVLVETKNVEKRNIFKKAWEESIHNFMKSETVINNTISNLKDGIRLTINIGAVIMSVGVISLLLAQYTKIFDYMGYLFYPITSILGFDSPFLVAKASTITLADMYVPAIISMEETFQTKFVIAVICISEILFFSASIPCILATDIPIKVRDMIIIWFERVLLSLILSVFIVKILF
ncbi:YjiH family protein [Fusobacterium necrophorum]|uniref:YjiH family protein n=1 Tax=Fusobacterium necrophorum TaxID=859 RepID=UPI0005642790|nr:YjiH family protein [Fusobacterium necrophorum]